MARSYSSDIKFTFLKVYFILYVCLCVCLWVRAHAHTHTCTGASGYQKSDKNPLGLELQRFASLLIWADG